MRALKQVVITGSIFAVGITSTSVFADGDTTSLREAFTKGKVNGSLKSYYSAETFDTATKEVTPSLIMKMILRMQQI